MAKTFYVLDPAVCDVSEWPDQAIEWEGDSASSVARDAADLWGQDAENDETVRVIVASKADGSDAAGFAFRKCISVDWWEVDFKGELP